LRANVAIPLDRGVWSVERRLLGSPAGPAYSSERQQSAYASVAGNRVKPVWIPPRGAALVELTRGGGKVTDALRAVRAGVALLNGSQRGASRRLRAPLMSATSHLARIAGGYRPRDRDVYLRDAHRAVLYVAHMRAIVANASRDSRSEPLRALLSRVQALEEALAEHCAGVNGIQTSTAIAWDDETQGEAIRVTISLTNGGDRPLSNLRLGLGGGSEAVAKPRECATFASLAPGHRVEAEFRLPAESKGSRIVSGITYVAYRSPIQLRSELNAEALGLSER
jgi:hypothetical protein